MGAKHLPTTRRVSKATMRVVCTRCGDVAGDHGAMSVNVLFACYQEYSMIVGKRVKKNAIVKMAYAYHLQYTHHFVQR
jgi:hypothetical protein